MALTQAQSLESLLLDGFNITSGEQLLIQDGLGSGTLGADATPPGSVPVYSTGTSTTATIGASWSTSGGYVMYLTDCVTGQVTGPYAPDSPDVTPGCGFSNPTSGALQEGPCAVAFWLGPFYVYCGNLGGVTVQLGGPAGNVLFSQGSGMGVSGSISISFGAIQVHYLNSNPGLYYPSLDQTYSGVSVSSGSLLWQYDPASTITLTLSSGSVNYTYSLATTAYLATLPPSGMQVQFWSAEPAAAYNQCVPNGCTGGAVRTASEPGGGALSLSNMTAWGAALDCTCAASGGGIAFSGGAGSFTATTIYPPGQNGSIITVNVGASSTLSVDAQAMDAFGSATKHPPDVVMPGVTGNVYVGDVTAGSGAVTGSPAPTPSFAWGAWPTGPFRSFNAFYNGLVGGSYNHYTQTYFNVMDPFAKMLAPFIRGYPSSFVMSIAPSWLQAEMPNTYNPPQLYLTDPSQSFDALAFSLASSQVVDTFSDVSNWAAASGTIGAAPGLNFSATATGAIVINTSYQLYFHCYRYLHLTLAGNASAARLWLYDGHYGRYYCLGPLSSTPTVVEIDLCKPDWGQATGDGAILNDLFGTGQTGQAGGCGYITGISFDNMVSGETLTCTNMTLVQKSAGLKGQVTMDNLILFMSDRKPFYVAPWTQWANLSEVATAVNTLTSKTGLSVTGPGSAVPTTTYNGGMLNPWLEWTAPDTDMTTQLTARFLLNGAYCSPGTSSYPMRVRCQMEHYVHGIEVGISAGTDVVRVISSYASQADETDSVDAATGYFRTGSRFPPGSEKCIFGTPAGVAQGNGVIIPAGGTTAYFTTANYMQWADMLNEPLDCGVAGSALGGGVCLLRDYTSRLHIYTGTHVLLYDDNDANAQSVLIDPNGSSPSFHLDVDRITGTYLSGTTAQVAVSRTHGRTWKVSPIPGNYTSACSVPDHSRIILLGYRAGNSQANPPTVSQWYCRVGVVQDDGTVVWSQEVNMNLSNPSGFGGLERRWDGVLEFTWTDGSGNVSILRGRHISNNGGKATDWT